MFMGSQELLMNGGIPNRVVDVLDGVDSEQSNSQYGSVQVGGDERIADRVLEGLDEYLYDINDRLIISRMVSDAVTKGMVTAVEQELAEKVATKELEVANLKGFLQSRKLFTSEHEGIVLPVVEREHQVGNDSWSSLAGGCMSHEKMREDLHCLRKLMRERFNEAEKEIEYVWGSNPIKKTDSGSELVGLGGILLEKHSDSLAHVNETLECLKMTMDSLCTKVDDMLLSSKVSLCEWQKDFDLLTELENIVIQSILRSLQEEFEGNLLQHNGLVSGGEYVNWIEKFNDISCISSQLDVIMKALSIPETGLVSHGSRELDPLNQNYFQNHATSPPSLHEENGVLVAPSIHVVESYDFQQLNHLTEEELVNFFNSVITKMRRDHESAIHQKTEEHFRLKRDYLKLRGSFATRKDEELDLLKKMIRHVILKLEDFLYENQSFPSVKHILDSLLYENQQLRDCLSEKENQIKCLEAQVSDAAVAEKNIKMLSENANSIEEDARIEASLCEEVYKYALREQIKKIRWEDGDSKVEFLAVQDVCKRTVVPAENGKHHGIEASDIESSIMHGLNGLVLTEVTKEVLGKNSYLYEKVLLDREVIINLKTKVIEKENDLQLELEEKNKLKHVLFDLGTAMDQKEKLVMDLSSSLSKQREELCTVSYELTQQQALVTESNGKFELLRSKHLEVLKQIEANKMKIDRLNLELDQAQEVLTKACNERNEAFTLAKEKNDKLLQQDAQEKKVKEVLQMAANGFTTMFDDFALRLSSEIGRNISRLQDADCHLRPLPELAKGFRRTELLYKQRCADLRLAEEEEYNCLGRLGFNWYKVCLDLAGDWNTKKVDLLGDQVDDLLRLLEKVYIGLDHYAPVLKHYSGIMEILQLVRRELRGESVKLH